MAARLRGGRQRTLLPHRERIAAACSSRVSVLLSRGQSKRCRYLPSPHPTAAAWSTQNGLVHSLPFQCTTMVPDYRCFTGCDVWRVSGTNRCLSGGNNRMEPTSSPENARGKEGGEEDVLGPTSAAIAPGEGTGKRVVVGMSGGVDSSVVAMLLQQQASGCRVGGRHHAQQWACV